LADGAASTRRGSKPAGQRSAPPVSIAPPGVAAASQLEASTGRASPPRQADGCRGTVKHVIGMSRVKSSNSTTHPIRHRALTTFGRKYLSRRRRHPLRVPQTVHFSGDAPQLRSAVTRGAKRVVSTIGPGLQCPFRNVSRDETRLHRPTHRALTFEGPSSKWCIETRWRFTRCWW
jgi:hypothetical protein